MIRFLSVLASVMLLAMCQVAHAASPPWEVEDRVSKLERQVAELTKRLDSIATPKVTTGDPLRNLTVEELKKIDPWYVENAPDVTKACINGNCTDGQTVKGASPTGNCSGGCDCSKSVTGTAYSSYSEGGGQIYAAPQGRRVLFSPRIRGAFRGGCSGGSCGG